MITVLPRVLISAALIVGTVFALLLAHSGDFSHAAESTGASVVHPGDVGAVAAVESVPDEQSLFSHGTLEALCLVAVLGCAVALLSAALRPGGWRIGQRLAVTLRVSPPSFPPRFPRFVPSSCVLRV